MVRATSRNQRRFSAYPVKKAIVLAEHAITRAKSEVKKIEGTIMYID